MHLYKTLRKSSVQGVIAFFTLTLPAFSQIKPQNQIQAPSGGLTPFTPAAYPAGVKLNYVRVFDAMGYYTSPNSLLSAGYLHVKQGTQYMDGLGRPSQAVQRQISPLASDLVTAIHYDSYGRDQYKFLPYVQVGGTNDGGFKSDPFNNQKNFYQSSYTDANSQLMVPGEQFFYGKTDFEPSPLNRVKASMAPGNSWAGNSKGVETTYMVNASGDAVRIWTITSNPLSYNNEDVNTNVPATSSTYSAGELFKTITKDERGKAVVEYKDKEGKMLLKKVQIGSVPTDFSGYDNWLCTYYIYDDQRQLRFVIPPKAVEAIKNSWSLSADAINELCFRYEYDGRNRMIAKKVPGAGWTYLIYDLRDRLVFSQDANLRNLNRWSATLYDALNRPVVSGIMTYQSTPSSLQQVVNNQNIENTPMEGVVVNRSPIPSGASFTALSVSYYDNYDFTSINYTTSYNSILNAGTNTHVDDMPTNASRQIKGLVTGTKNRVIEDPNNLSSGTWLTTVNFYDDKGRIIQTHSQNFSGGTDIQTSLYNFSGTVLSTYLVHRNPSSPTSETRIRTDYSYDHALRLLEVAKVINDDNSKKVIVAKNSYDALGNLIRKELGRKKNTDGSYSSAPLEQLDYTYNIRGWMKGINAGYSHPELPGSSGQSGRYFGMELSYDWGFSQNQLNGNIGGVRWRSKGDGEIRAYGFAYDDANRILKADFTQSDGSDFNQSAGINFDVKMGNGTDPATAYDPNGNIKQMQQWGLKIGSSSQIDNLGYNYQAFSNKLEKVTDTTNDPNSKLGDFKDGNNGGNDYAYDANGNLILDNNKSISSITYNHLNLPSTITITGKGTVNYVYDASGNKMRKRTVDNTVSPAKTTTTHYLGGAVYVNDTLQFIGHEEGRMRLRTSDNSFQYDYFIKDHLGNVRMLLTDELRKDKYPVASLETAKTAIEDSIYTIDRSKVVNASSVTGLPTYTNDNGIGNNPSDPTFEQANSQKLYQLNSNTNKIGLGIALKVMAGDRIDVFGKSYWYTSNTGGSSANSAPLIMDLLNGLMGTPTGAASGSHTTATELSGISGVTLPLGSFISSPDRDNSSYPQRPKAFINYIFFDEQFKAVSQGISAVSSTAGIKDHFSDLQNLIAGKNGYIYIYCSNESPVNVFFDNLQVVHTRGPLLEETHYYPFGLAMAGISSKALNGVSENKKGYNGNEIQNKEFADESGLDVYDFNARTFDQQLGRFLQIDPLFEDQQESLTPYHFSFNNPIRFNDPNGKSPDGCCDLGELWQDVKNVARQGMLSISGALNAWSSNQLLGAGRVDPNKEAGLTPADRKAVAAGQAVGDAASIVTGVFEMGLASGVELVSAGGATPIALPLGVHGVSSVTMGATNLISQTAKVNASKGSDSNPHSSSKAARRDAMRKEGVPTSQQPIKQKQTSAGRVLEYDVPTPGGGATKKQAQQQTKDRGHGPHWEVGSLKKGGQKDPAGRNRLQNSKSKSYYNE